MIYLHKLLPVLFSPIVIVTTILVIGLIKNKKIFILSGIFLLYLSSTPIVSNFIWIQFVEKQTRTNPESLPNADAIVVLSGMVSEVSADWGKAVEWSDPDRFFGGITAYKLGKAQTLIFTAGLLPWQSKLTAEGVVLKRFAVMMGLPAKDILITEPAQNTEQEAIEVKKLLMAENPSILLVTSAFHMARAKKIFERIGITVYEYPVDFKQRINDITVMDFLPSSLAIGQSELTIRELIGQLYYGFKNL